MLQNVAGDITDAKLEDREGSRQFEDEWREYDRVLQETGILDKTVWLDTRGNHGMYHVREGWVGQFKSVQFKSLI